MSTHSKRTATDEVPEHSHLVVAEGKQLHIPVVDFYHLTTSAEPGRNTNHRKTKKQPSKFTPRVEAAHVNFSKLPFPPSKPPRRLVDPHPRHANKPGKYSQVPGHYTKSGRVVEVVTDGATNSKRIGTNNRQSRTGKTTPIPSGQEGPSRTSKTRSNRVASDTLTEIPKKTKVKAAGSKARPAVKNTAPIAPKTCTAVPKQGKVKATKAKRKQATAATKKPLPTPAVDTSKYPVPTLKCEPPQSGGKGILGKHQDSSVKHVQTKDKQIPASKPNPNKGSSGPKIDSQPPSSQAAHDKPKTKSRLGYKEYLSPKQVRHGLEQGTLYRGVVRINKNNTIEAYATCDGLTQDVFIYGRHARNRALHGDKVIVALVDSKAVMMERRSKRRRGGRGQAEKSEAGSTPAQPVVDSNANQTTTENKSNGVDKHNNTDQVESESDSSTVNQTKEPEKLCGEIVYIEPSDKPRYICGVLQPTGKQKKGKSDQAMASPTITSVQLVPDDLRMPLVTIHNFDRFPNIAEDIQRGTLFQVRITKWSINGYYPMGVIEKRLGQRGELDVEIEGLLVDNNVPHTPFPPSVEDCLPQLPWSIPAEELVRRRDLRNECIFTIDPATAKDLDDAVSCRALPNGNFEVGVHIADVSHFVHPNTALDKEAQERATTVYLTDKAIPMLPRVLCEELCSLQPGVDRLAFSVIWEMTPRARVVNVWFGRTVINSCCQLAYEQAQVVVEGQSLPPTSTIMRHTRRTVEETIRSLFGLSTQLRDRRFAGGALSITSIKLHFDLDSQGQPIGCKPYDIKDSNRLIEEFMLLANMSVAEKLVTGLPDLALLRCHPKPIHRSLKQFRELVQTLGYQVDISTAGTLHRSLTSIDDPVHQTLLQYLAVKPMCRALYFCTGQQEVDQFSHYALNVPLYTHFTSPIRRYADVMVHRMLDHLLSNPEQPLPWESTTIHNIALHCNDRKHSARLAQDRSSKVYLIQYLQRLIREQNGEPVRCQAYVLQASQASGEILVWEYGIEEQIFWKKLTGAKYEYQKSHHRCFIDWSSKPTKNSKVPTNSSQSNANGENGAESTCQELVNGLQNLDLDRVDQPVSGQKLSGESNGKRSRSAKSLGGIKAMTDPSGQDFIKSHKLNPKFTQEISLFSVVPVTLEVNIVRGVPSINVQLVNPFQ
ncbi:hypothetical protein IWQ62_001510 [Dispira parvispora]|uniref:DIS3-like exonuclease 2 n=1 Tax=Dispira parvispora TaxID=1520584 RepID=A0A9W8ASE2_9FUNG|nr:hypothetical protein IWQ62_001510 [Dispira parvispora]